MPIIKGIEQQPTGYPKYLTRFLKNYQLGYFDLPSGILLTKMGTTIAHHTYQPDLEKIYGIPEKHYNEEAELLQRTYTRRHDTCLANTLFFELVLQEGNEETAKSLGRWIVEFEAEYNCKMYYHEANPVLIEDEKEDQDTPKIVDVCFIF